MHSGAMSSKIVADVTQSVLKSIPPQIAVGVNAFPHVQAREHNPLVGCWPFVYSLAVVTGESPVVVTGAQPPFFKGAVVIFPCGSHRSTAPLFRAVIC